MNEGAAAVNPLLQMAPFALILVVFYFLLIRPQQQKAKETQEMLDALKTGDDIVTVGGIHGRVVKLADAMIHVEVAPKVQIRLERSSVSKVERLARAAEAKSGTEKS